MRVDALLIAGLLCFLAGVYLLAGLAWLLIAAGVALIFAAYRLAQAEEQRNEPDETTIQPRA